MDGRSYSPKTVQVAQAKLHLTARPQRRRAPDGCSLGEEMNEEKGGEKPYIPVSNLTELPCSIEV